VVGEAAVAARTVTPSDGLMVVCGSLYVVADARRVLLEGAPRL
jgi:folylpolyglutamate synthase/dihydropteroate synthase